MDKQQAQRIIEDTFEKAFDKRRFIKFIVDLLNLKTDQIENKHPYSGNYIPDAYEQHMSTLERIGKYTDGEHKIDILVVKLKKSTSIERARTTQRNFIARYLNGSRGGELKDAALVAFVSPDEEDWRFSLVKMDYRFEEGKDGKVKVKEEFTPARRWSFLVGKNESSHTAQRQLVDILADDEHNPTFAQLESAFNIETVTKEFFEKYRELFLLTKETLDTLVSKDSKIRADFEAKAVNTVDFAKKLLGQIVFLYFLQKKGWFGVKRDAKWGTGPKNFLRELFEGKYGSYQNFFNDILESLFYEALARERDDDFYSRFNCKIPFLNGGLFDPIGGYDWVHTDILLPDKLFSNTYKTKEGDTGNGILDIFDRYNFTVKEDEPLEKEVAVDPEMLGKVFENLLEVKDRKSKGTYYTPREIVHYMCQQSLINYLHTELNKGTVVYEKFGDQQFGMFGNEIKKGQLDLIIEHKSGPSISKDDIEILIKYGEQVGENEARVQAKGRETDTYFYKLPESIRQNAKLIDDKLAEIKICDPAIGSGAFPVGMMSEIIKARNVLSAYICHSRETCPRLRSGNGNPEDKSRSIYNFKRECIENSLYGVDIDPGAVEIAKLRLWLSLVVDEEEYQTIKPLPNLDYKIMQGNSLIEDFHEISLDLKRKEGTQMDLLGREAKLDRLIEDLHQKQIALFNATHPSDKKRKKEEVENAIVDIFHYELQWQKDPHLGKKYNFDFEAVENELREMTHGNKVRSFFPWKLYFADVFRQNGGFDVVIANPPYVGEKGHKEIFREIKQGNLGNFYQGKMDLFYFFFHLALNLGRQPANIAFITTNYYPTATGAKKLRQDFKERAIIKNLINFNELKIFESALGQHNMITILEKPQNEKAIAQTCITHRQGAATPEILQQILNGNDTGTRYCKVAQKDLYDGNESYIRINGINSEHDPLNKILNKIQSKSSRLDEICDVKVGLRTGIDKISKKHLEIESNHHIGESVFILRKEEYQNIPKEERSIIKPLFKNSDIQKWKNQVDTNYNVIYLKSESKIGKYPSIKKHLSKFKNLIEKIRKNDGEVWYSIVRPREERIFTEPKIIAPQRSRYNSFAYNEIEFYGSSDIYYIVSKKGIEKNNLKYVIALLNSKLYYLWFYHRGKRKGETLELYQKPLSEIPIKKISKSEQQPFIHLVNQILSLKKSDPNTDTSALEAEIDRLVYALYDLTEEEIAIVEESVKVNDGK
ncbi:Eco57I restriction-modification methylase domain-containing protein [bacterium]|nr:Eco57I restriction-modification methylase domain-containing protein [bacterium]